MKRQKRLLLVVIMLFTLLLSATHYDASNINTNSLINITECSSSFMNKYFEEVSKIEDEDKENILIVTSKTKIIDTYGATKTISAPNNQYILVYSSVETKDKAMDKLSRAKGIVTVEENIIYEISSYNSWGVTSTGMDIASKIIDDREDKEDIVVAIIDTGLDVTLFKNNYPTKLAGTYNGLTGSTAESSMKDENGHGTHIAGTIAESTPSNVKIYPAKASNGSTLSSTDIIACINYIVHNKKANVINMSFGSYTPHTATRQAIQAANNAGIICVAAAGNESTAQTAYPAGYDETIAVSAIDLNNNLASFSNTGSNITFAAPGVNIKSINGTMGGTSMASPHVAAAVAIVKSYNKDLTMTEVVDILKVCAVDLGTPGWDYQFGYGAISFKYLKYCSCNCEECYSVGCDGCDCLRCRYMDITNGVTSITVSNAAVETYNYGSITNLANTELKIYYGSNYLTKKLYELDDVTITGYDPYKYTSQTVTITFAGKSTTLTLSARTEPQSFWDYSVVTGTNIKLTGMKATPIPRLHLPEKIGNYTVTTIGTELFKEAALTVVTMPSSINNIETNAFISSDITKLVANASTLTVGKSAFAGCANLEEVTAELVFTGTDAFEECYSLKSAVVSNLNTTLPYGTFYLCTNLENLTLPSSITSIGAYAVTNTSIDSIVIPTNVTSIGNYAFGNSFSLKSLTLNNKLQTIGEGAFIACTNLPELNIPASVTSIGNKAFRSCTSLSSITVASGNTVYDSRNDANALIETSSNKLITGTYETTIPSTVKTIGEYAFAFNQLLYSIELPEGITNVDTMAFYGVQNLMQIIMPTTLTTIGTEAFSYTPANLVFWVHSSSYSKTYAANNGRVWRAYNPSAMTVYGAGTTYTAFETFPVDSIYLEVEYTDYNGTRTENIYSGIKAEYQSGNTSFRATDTSVIISAKNNIGKEVRGRLTITVNKANPKYTIPTGIKATLGQTLSEISLPEGFEWQEPLLEISNVGKNTYLAKYTPDDTTNYNIINNISIEVEVLEPRSEIIPTVTVKDKVYDGTLNISAEDIEVAELKKTEYTVVSATISSADVGQRTATITLKLTDEKFKTLMFSGGKQEYTAQVPINILYAKVVKPTKVDKTYTYNGTEQTFELADFNSSIMNISGNKRTHAGSQTVSVTLSNSNYAWEDGTRTAVTFTFVIKKANIEYTAADTHNFKDGKSYGIEVSVTNPDTAIIRYANNQDEYILDDMPKYSTEGVHTIKFKIADYNTSNYNEVYDERKVYIYGDEIVNLTKDKEVIYDGLEHTLTMDVKMSDVTIKYSVGNTDYDLDILPTFKYVGEYVVNYKIEKTGYLTVYGSNKVKIYGIKETGSSLRIDGTYLRIKDFNTNSNDVINKIKVYAPSYLFLIHDKNGVDKNTSVLYTGDKVTLYLNSSLGTNELKYTVIVLGDANLDGKISALDYVRIKNHIMKDPAIKDELSLLSADANDDGKVSALDYVRIKNHIMDGGK